MNKPFLPALNTANFQNNESSKDLISKITYFFTIIFIFLVPWGDGLWDGTPRIAATISFGLSALLFLTRGTQRNYTIAHLFIILYFTWQLISIIWSPDQEYGIQVATTAIQLLLLVFLITLVINTKEKILLAYQVYVLGNIIGSFIIIYNYLNGIMSLYYGRYGIVNIETDTLSIILALAIPMSAYLATKSHNKLIKTINLLAIPLVFYAIFLTGTRTGSIVGVLGIFYWIFTYRKSSIIIKTFISLVMVGSIIAIFTFAPKASIDRVFSASQSINTGTLNGRTIIWRNSLEHWKKAPMIGTGLGGLGYALSKEHVNYRSAHNSYVHILAVNGLVGLLFYLLIIGALFYFITLTPFEEKIFLVTLLLCLLLSQVTTHTQTEKYLWILFSLIIIHTKKFTNEKTRLRNAIPT